MAIISIAPSPVAPGDTNVAGTYYIIKHQGSAEQDISVIATTTTSVVAATSAIYRGRLGGGYVYSTGTPPGGGATDIVIIGYI